MGNHVEKANQYIENILSGKIPACKWVKLACQRQLSDLKRWPDKRSKYWFDEQSANKVCKFVELLPHTKGKWAGSLIVLEGWQCFILTTVFGWKRQDGTRRFRIWYECVPRKMGKSIKAAAIGLYMLVEDGEHGAEIFSGATTEKQAWEVFRPAKLMASRAEGFCDHYGVTVHASNISDSDSASRFEPLIGEPGDGASPSCAIVDEYHEHKTDNLYNTMITGMGAREQPLMIVITTAGTDTGSPCYDLQDSVCLMLQKYEGFENDELFGIIYTIDEKDKDNEGDDWTTYEALEKANPNFGVSVGDEFLLARQREAIQKSSKQNAFKTKHLNIWCNAAQVFFNMEKWKRCEDKSLKIENFRGELCWIGIDLASKIDIAAMIVVFLKDGIHYVFPFLYLPEKRLEEKGKEYYISWVKDGHITATHGHRIDFDTIKNDLRDLVKHYRVEDVSHDPWNAAQFVADMEKEGLEMIEIAQTVNNLSEPMKELEALILGEEVRHNGNPAMNWMMANVMARMDKKDNVFPFKEKDAKKIDGPVALINAMNRIIAYEPGEEYGGITCL